MIVMSCAGNEDDGNDGDNDDDKEEDESISYNIVISSILFSRKLT